MPTSPAADCSSSRRSQSSDTSAARVCAHDSKHAVELAMAWRQQALTCPAGSH
jgi:hypothetical protein